jgi:hypothetical protein
MCTRWSWSVVPLDAAKRVAWHLEELESVSEAGRQKAEGA